MFVRLATVPEPIPTDFTAQVSFDAYCAALDGIAAGHTASRIMEAGVFDALKGFAGPLLKFLNGLKEQMTEIAGAAKAGLLEIVAAFKSKDIFALLRAIGFNLQRLLSAVRAASGLLRGGLLAVFKELAKTKAIQQIQKGTLKIDALLDRYPILRKLAGPVIAGLLLYIWLNMSFIGNSHYDLDLSAIGLALVGHYSLEALFASPDGLMMISLFALGTLTGLSFPWLGGQLVNLLAALAYTGATQLRQSPLAAKLRPLLNHI